MAGRYSTEKFLLFVMELALNLAMPEIVLFFKILVAQLIQSTAIFAGHFI